MDCVEMSSITCGILGFLVFGWAPNYLILGAQLAPVEKMLVCIPAFSFCSRIRCGLSRLEFIKCLSEMQTGKMMT